VPAELKSHIFNNDPPLGGRLHRSVTVATRISLPELQAKAKVIRRHIITSTTTAASGHPNYRRLAGVEASTGSLGQGLSIGVGAALAARLDNTDARVYVMTGDGELAEGQIWEALMSAAKYRLDNLVLIVDQNGYQQTGATAEVLDLRPLAPRFEAFGWFAEEINGHDLNEILQAFERAKHIKGKPSAIIARTVKGYPIHSLLASDPNHHGKPLTKDEAEKALAMIG